MAKHKNYRPLPTSFIDPIVSKLKIPRFRAKKSKLQIKNGAEMKYVIDTSSFHARIERRCRGSSKRISNPSFERSVILCDVVPVICVKPFERT